MAVIQPDHKLSTPNVITKKRLFVVFVVIFINLIAWLDEGAFNALTPIWATAYHLDAVQIGQVASAMMLGYFPALFLAGTIADRFGSKRVLVVSFVGVLVTAACMLVVKSYGSLYLRNVIFGVCNGLIWGPAYRWMAMWLPSKDRIRYGGMFVIGAQFSVAISAPLALGLSAVMDWKIPFIFVTLLGIPILLIMLFATTETPEKRKGISQEELSYIYSDHVSAEALKAEEFSWSAFGSLFKIPSVWTITLATGCIMGSSWVTTIWTSVALVNGYKLSAELASMLIMISLLIAVVLGYFAGTISNKLFKGNMRHALTVGPVIGGLSYLIVALTLPHYLVFSLLAGTFGYAMGGFWYSNLAGYIAGLVDAKYAGTLNGLSAGMSTLIGYIFILQSGKWINPTVAGLASMSRIYLYGGILCLLTLVFVYMSKAIIINVKSK